MRELRQRIHGEQVVEYDLVHLSLAMLGGDEVSGMGPLAYDPAFRTFVVDAAKRIRETEKC